MANNLLGSYLKNLRKSHHYTQEYVASHLDIIRQSYSHYETGRTRPGLEMLGKLASLYDIPLDNLLKIQLSSELSDTGIRLSPDVLPCGKDAETPSLSAKDRRLIRDFHRLKEDDQQDILDFIEIKLSRRGRTCP